MRPGRTLFIAAAAWFLLGTAAFFSDTALLVWIIGGAAVLPLIVLDFAALLCLTDPLRLTRRVSPTLALGQPASVTITLLRSDAGAAKNTGGGFIRSRSLELFDIYPDGMETGDMPLRIRGRALARGERLECEYRVVPVERGPWEFPRIEALLASPLGCWRRRVTHNVSSTGATFPDFKKLAGSNIAGSLELTGIKEVRKRGQGMEFMGLREYQKGDSVKAVDWRATGRRSKFIVREYQEEQDQQLLFLLDSGYRLYRQENDGEAGRPRTQFDSALESAMLLSWVALKHGDGVALGCFGAEERWLPPRKGMSALPALMRSLYDVKSAPVPSSLFSALESALARLKRRTFIIMISNFREEDEESLSWILKRIERRHLLLLVSLREREAEELARAETDDPLQSAAAFAYLYTRRRLYKKWEHLGLLTLESSAGKLSSALVNRYLEVKRSGRL
ncbi:MAG: DUF58 domain-containing protein [Treponema sp.]|jgi:uncharacterized protein (DUF58 family)|nr:DUF58 domain-containing protein [Treponema sp.]